MLNITQQIKVNNASLPIQARFEMGSCASYDIVSIVDDIITVNFYFVDQTCYEQNKITKLIIKDGANCEIDFPVSIKDPCEDFVVNDIKRIRGLKFRADVAFTDGQPYTYVWTWDAQVLEEVNPAIDGVQGEEIEFRAIKKLKEGDKTKINLQVFNTHGCCARKTLNYEFCGPQVFDGKYETVCDTDGPTTGKILLVAYPCGIDEACGQSDVPIDWSTLTLDLPDRVKWTNYGNGRFRIDFPADWPPKSTVNIPYCVKDIAGVEACAMLCILVQPCDTPAMKIFNMTGLLGCADCVADPEFDTQNCANSPVLIAVDDYIVGSPDWSTFEFVPGVGDVVISLTEVQTPHGNFSIGLNRAILYTPGDFQGNDYIKIKMKSTAGVTTYGEVFIQNTPECVDGSGVSLVTANDDEICVKCGQSITFNPLANDIGESDASTISISFPPPEVGTLQVFTDGKMKFTANAGYDGEYVLPYTVKDINGRTSNEAFINLNIFCDIQNDAYNESICRKDSSTVSLFDYLNTTDKTHLWTLEAVSFDERPTIIIDGKTEYVDVGDKVGKDYKPVLSFVNSKVGIYTFGYGDAIGSCSNKILVKIEIVEPAEFPQTDETYHACITDTAFDFTTKVLTVLPTGGTWLNIDPGTLPVPIFDPSQGSGKYTFKYKIQNLGTYSQACDSEFIFYIIVHDEVYAGEDACVNLCTDGPGDGDPGFGCRDPKVVSKYTPGDCEVCLFDTLFENPGKTKTKGGYWTLEAAPHEKKNAMFINGELAFIDIGEVLPGDQEPGTSTPLHNPCVDLGNSDVGDYDFQYHVGTEGTDCFDEAIVSVALFPAPCQPKDITLEVCQSEGVVTLWSLIEKYYEDSCGECDGVCKPLEEGNWTVISDDKSAFSLSEDKDGTNDTIDTDLVGIAEDDDYTELVLTYEFFKDLPGDSCQGGCETCETCSQKITVKIRVIRGDFAGEPHHVTACCVNGEGCLIDLKDLVDVPNGTWKYLGCNENSSDAPDPDCTTLFPEGIHPGEELGNEFDLKYPFCDLPYGFYFFQYEVCGPNPGDCCSRIIIKVQVMGFGDPGTDTSCEACTNEPACINLFDTLGGTPTPGGKWTSKNNMAPVALNPCTGTTDLDCGKVLATGDKGFYSDASGDGTNATFNTQNVKPGVYQFDYVVPLGTVEFGLSDCAGCDTAVASVQITITEIKEIGDGTNLTVCNEPNCPVDLWDLLTVPKQMGCEWIYDGCANDSGGVDPGCTTTVKVGVSEFNPGDTLGIDHVIVDFGGKPVGFYYFTYRCTAGESCEETAQVIIQVVEPDCAGDDVSCNICAEDPVCVNLYDFLASESSSCTVQPGGLWFDVSAVPAPVAPQCTGTGVSESCGEYTLSDPGGFFDDSVGNGTGATFNTKDVPDGTYVFKYMNVMPPAEFDFTDCDACNDAMGSVTIVLGSGGTSGSGNDKDVCN